VGFAVTGNAGSPSAPPLVTAVLNGDLNAVKAMIATGADVNVSMKTGYTPLCAASGHGKREIAEYLIAHGALVNSTNFFRGYTPLYWAVAMDNKDMIPLLLAKGADINVVSGDGRLLAVARSEGVVKLLLNNGVAVNVPDDGRPPLHAAVYKGRLNIAKELLAHGADGNATNSQSQTPLGTAIEEKNSAAIKFLKARNAK
jgi:ankyrin repeat protein